MDLRLVKGQPADDTIWYQVGGDGPWVRDVDVCAPGNHRRHERDGDTGADRRCEAIEVTRSVTMSERPSV